MPTKISKFIAKASDKLRLNGSNRLFYHLGRPNFGDDINPWFFNQISGLIFKWGGTDRANILGIGSIAAKATDKSIVVGSGFIEPVDQKYIGNPRIVSLRGIHSAEIFGVELEFLGDPVSLIDLLYRPQIELRHQYGFVPHVSEYGRYMELLKNTDINVINPSKSHFQVVDEILSCKQIVSQSLHGLIVADAYAVPNAWVAPSDNMIGGVFKFNDYFSTINEKKASVNISLPKDFDFFDYTVGQFKFDKFKYLNHIKSSLSFTHG